MAKRINPSRLAAEIMSTYQPRQDGIVRPYITELVADHNKSIGPQGIIGKGEMAQNDKWYNDAEKAKKKRKLKAAKKAAEEAEKMRRKREKAAQKAAKAERKRMKSRK